MGSKKSEYSSGKWTGWSLLEEFDKSANDSYKLALDTDIKEIGASCLLDGSYESKVKQIKGPLVVQLQKLRNISAPKENEQSSVAPQLFKLVLTDGHANFQVLLMTEVAKINLNTAPGTKVIISGSHEPVSGYFLLTKDHIKVLGGKVEKLVENWQLKKTFSKQTREVHNGDNAPPPFIPFGSRQRLPNDSARKGKADNFKALQTPKSVENNSESSEFQSQREAVIAEAVASKKETGPSRFSQQQHKVRDVDLAAAVDMGFRMDLAEQALRKHGNLDAAVASLLEGTERGDAGRRRGRGREEFQGRGRDREEFQGRSRGRDEFQGRGRGREEHEGSSEEAGSGYEGRGGRKGRGGHDDDEAGEGSSRPSGPSTLFDFLDKKIPLEEKPQKQPSSQYDAGSKPAYRASSDSRSSRQPESARGRSSRGGRSYEGERSSTEHHQFDHEDLSSNFKGMVISNTKYSGDRKGSRGAEGHDQGQRSAGRGANRGPQQQQQQSRSGYQGNHGQQRFQQQPGGHQRGDQRQNQQHQAVDQRSNYTPRNSAGFNGAAKQAVNYGKDFPGLPSSTATMTSYYQQQQSSFGHHQQQSSFEPQQQQQQHFFQQQQQPQQRPRQPQIGQFCLAQWKDKMFYRARIDHVNGSLVQVTFVDYGDREVVNLNQIKLE